MKNIHVLPTEKPSRLYYHLELKQLVLTNKSILRDVVSNQNIYITSNEEIKEGEWFYNPKLLDAQKLFDRRDWKKIILTTDQDLIKDGVQAIDDEFLEWFVNNPSCEFIETDSYKTIYHTWLYKIILPVEEPKQSIEEYEQQGLEKYFEEHKQETLEEAAEHYAENEIKDRGTYKDKLICSIDFMAGAQWQQEQDKNKYSEGDMKSSFQVGFNVGYNDEESPSYLTFEEWIKEYKKK
jgi:hypothetical protein